MSGAVDEREWRADRHDDDAEREDSACASAPHTPKEHRTEGKVKGPTEAERGERGETEGEEERRWREWGACRWRTSPYEWAEADE